jgi:hypothetical protein
VLDHPAVRHVIELVESWNAPVWGEVLLYETLEGIRDRPFKLLPALEPATLHALKVLRDELGTWPAYVGGKWQTMPMRVWCIYAKENPADSIRDRMIAAYVTKKTSNG